MSSVRQSTPRRSSIAQLSSRPPTSRLDSVRASVQDLFTGRSTVGRPSRSQSPESPKTPRPVIPRPVIGLQNLPTTRINIPYLTRAPSSGSARSHSSTTSLTPYVVDTPLNSRSITPQSLRQQTEQPNVSNPTPLARHNSTRRFVGVDPAELHLAQLARDGRRRRSRAKTRNPSRATNRTCAPKIKNRHIRSKILSCFVSGLFLTLVLTIYLALALSNRNESQEFHVLLILIILITTIFFCHALIRLCIMLVHPPGESDLEQGLSQITGPGGYANPVTPVRVTLARDEEAVGIESEATKYPPPAYGLWRESVRVDPNRIFWQRNEAAGPSQTSSNQPEATASTGNRPPSYISEEGIDYVIEAQPRSVAPTTDVPLPPHPSEVERVRVWTGPTM